MKICKCIYNNEEKIANAKYILKKNKNLEKTANFFKILGDSTRFKIITILLEGEMCVCDIALSLNMTHSSISHQLKILRESRVVKNNKIGKVVYYSINDDHVNNIVIQGLKHHNH